MTKVGKDLKIAHRKLATKKNYTNSKNIPHLYKKFPG